MGMHRRHYLSGAHHKKLGFWTVLPLSVVFSFHALLVAYIHSTYMEQYVTPEAVGALFSVGSAIAVIAFLFFAHALRAVGNVKLTLILAMLDILSLFIMGATDHVATIIVAFVVFLTINPLLYLSIDIFSETIIGSDESSTGSKRGLTLMLMSIAAVIAPLAISGITKLGGGLEWVYFSAAAVFTLFIICILVQFKDFSDPKYAHPQVKATIHSLWERRDVRNVLLAHFTLQTFFTWAAIYMPLYLATEVGLEWDAIGLILAGGLMAYVVFEWPIGIIADKYIGEKEIMALGFVVLAVSSASVSFLLSTSIIAWTVLLFLTRTGASMVEITTESYFFKHTKGGDAHAISFFRLLRPLSTVTGALLGSAALLYLPFNLIFVVLGFMMVPGIFFTIRLRDTR